MLSWLLHVTAIMGSGRVDCKCVHVDNSARDPISQVLCRTQVMLYTLTLLLLLLLFAQAGSGQLHDSAAAPAVPNATPGYQQQQVQQAHPRAKQSGAPGRRIDKLVPIDCQELRKRVPELHASRLLAGSKQQQRLQGAGGRAAMGPPAWEPPQDMGAFMEELGEQRAKQERAVRQALPDNQGMEEGEWEDGEVLVGAMRSKTLHMTSMKQ
jgi:hypothetical protein